MQLFIVSHLFVLGLFLLCHFSNETFAHHSPQQCWSTLNAKQPPPDNVWSCFDNQCRCHDTAVDCSHSNISYAPRINNTVKLLNFSSSNLTEIRNRNFFLNAGKNVSELDLYNNNLTRIVFGVFHFMYKLKRVLMGGNHLTYDQIAPVLSVPRLSRIELKCGQLSDIPKNFFSNRPCCLLRYLDMSWNSVEHLDMAVFQPLGWLEILLLRYNMIQRVTSAFHPYLKEWILHKNRLFDFPTTCDKDGASLYPNLTVLDLGFNEISDISDSVCLPSLTILSLSFNKIEVFYKDMFSIQRFPMLRKLRLTQMAVKIKTMENFVFNNSNINDIDLGFNTIDFSLPNIDEDVFQGCSNLTKLFLDRTNLAHVTHQRFQSLFGSLTSLKILYLGKTGLQLSHDTFEKLTGLTELYLYGNSMRSFPDGVFDELVNLTVLKLGNNQITHVSNSAFSVETRTRLEKVDLSGNPFSCTCAILPLKEWMESQPHKFLDFQGMGYQCENIKNMTVQDFYIPEQACIFEQSTNILILGFCIMFIVLLVFFMIICKWRWHFYLWFYERRHPSNQVARQDVFRYHVFLVYDEYDSYWIRHTLLPVLEEKWELKVCVHERDFDPGRHVIDSIDASLQDSHSILMIFSSNFANCSLRQYELRVCEYEAARTNCPLAAVLLPRDRRPRLTNSMVRVLKTTLPLEWTEDPDAKQVFWRQLLVALKDAIQKAREDRLRDEAQ